MYVVDEIIVLIALGSRNMLTYVKSQSINILNEQTFGNGLNTQDKYEFRQMVSYYSPFTNIVL
jgi:hypothetical protein